MRFSSPNSRLAKAAREQRKDGQRPQPQDVDSSKKPGKEAPNEQFLHVDIVGGHLRIVPAGAGKLPAGVSASQAAANIPVSKSWDALDDLEYAVTKAMDEERYTFGPLYTPGEVDAHQEFVDRQTLTKAMRAFAMSGTRTINKQHRTGSAPIGNIVDWVVWPYEAEVELGVPGRDVRKAVLPAGTAYVGVVWEPHEWPSVKGGAITGYSLGGRAMRVGTGEILPPSRR